jgi:hypothetical protein
MNEANVLAQTATVSEALVERWRRRMAIEYPDQELPVV